MKKIIILTAIALATYTSNAQVGFGVKAGVNISSWSGSDATGTSSLTGFYGGGLVNIPISSMFSVQPEVLFSGEGVKATTGDEKIVTSFVNIPVMAQYNTHGFTLETGPQLGILVSAKAKGGGFPEEDVKSSFNSTNFSWAFGAAYKLAMGLGFNARFNLGLSNLSKDSQSTIKSSVFSLGAFYALGGKSNKDRD